jgi:uncharacterized protein YhdP
VNAQDVMVTVKSDLVGVDSQLPAPLAKLKTQSVPSVVNVRLNNDHSMKLQFQLSDFISGALQYAQDGQALSAGQIHLGGKAAEFQNMPGLVIDGEAPKIDWDKWKTIFKKLSENNQNMDHYPLREVHLFVPRFDIFGQAIKNATIALQMLNEGWEITIHSDEVAGIIDVPIDHKNQTLVINLDYLYWKTLATPNAKNTALDLTTLPNIDAQIKVFQYQDKILGEVNIKLKGKTNGIEITNVLVQNPGFKMQAGGFFTTGKTHQTEFRGTITSEDTKKMLKQWGIAGNLESPQARLGFDLTWPGTIADFSFADSEGHISIHVKKGRITGLSKDTDVKLGLGRLVTILSLQSLPKRLQFNFKDLTKKGYFFDKMHGDFSLKSGVASTQDANLQGPVAQIDITGDIQLREQTYDLKCTVLPNLTASLPVVATIAGGPVVGAAAWVADKLVGKQVNKMTQHRYHVSGAWDNPTIEQVKQHYLHEVARAQGSITHG